MSARRIKIKTRHREVRKQAASAHSSPITPSAIFGSPAIDLDEDYLDFPCPELDPAHHHAFDNSHAIIEKFCRDCDSAQAAGRPLCASDMDSAQAAGRPLCASDMDSAQAAGRPLCASDMDSAQAAGRPLCASDMDSAQAAGRPLCASDMDGAESAPQPLDAKSLSWLYSTDFLKTAPSDNSSNTSAAAAPIPDTPTPAPILPAPAHSTGPRTLEGKARSSQNAVKHGLTVTAGAALVFLSSEEADHYLTLSTHFTQQFVPMTGAEREIVREITDTLTLARRARDLQTSALMKNDDRALALYLRYETAHLRAHNAAIKTLLVLQKDRRQRNENHEKWNEPVHWGEYTFASDDDSPETESSESSTAATTSASPADLDTSFRNLGFKPWSEMFSNPNAVRLASNNATEEVKRAA